MAGGFKRIVNQTIVPFIGFWWILLIGLTLRVRVIGSENEEFVQKNRCILAFWHSRIFYMPYHFKWQSKWLILASPSADGDIISGILRLFGFSTVRGSSFQKGRSALIALAKKVRNGESAAMIADGSRGPARVAQAGSISLAKLTGAPVVPIAFSAEKNKTINSWDKTVFPFPFTKVSLVFGKPIEVDRKMDSDGLDASRLELEKELNRVTDIADSSFA